MRTLLTRVAAMTAAAALTLIAAPATAGPTVDIRPGALPRGVEGTVPYVFGTNTIIDAEHTVRVRTQRPIDLLGKAPGGYVVAGTDPRDRTVVWFVNAQGQRRVLSRGQEYAEVSDSGSALVTSRGYRPTTLSVINVGTGTVVRTRTFRGVRQGLDVHRGKVLVGGGSGALWTLKTNTVRPVTTRSAYNADLSNDLMATFSGDPYRDGCTTVTRISNPATRVWHSCEEAVHAWSPDGKRMVTAYKLSDGPGPHEVDVRGVRGKHIATYRVARNFGPIVWESNLSLMLWANGRDRAAMVRCMDTTCQRVSRLTTPTEY